MRFSIITPTYKRSEKLARAVDSVLSQTYKDFEMIIINDSPYDDSYAQFATSINDPRIRYYANDSNRGVNYSRNFGLDKVSADSKWVIFLDDDDYLAPDALATFNQLILTHPGRRWFVTNRARMDGTPITFFGESDTEHSYAWEYLILKICKGDVTHCIETKMLTQENIRFSRHIKQAEEWLFYFQVSRREKLFYHDHNSTISGGYDEITGLNFRRRLISSQLETWSVIFYEGKRTGILFTLPFVTYLLLRLIRIPLSIVRRA